MKKRWKILLGLGGAVFVAALAPIIYVETGCGGAADNARAAPYASPLAKDQQRPEARSWLTYPEWHIVYSADSLGRHLATGNPPSAYDYWSDIGAFWRSTCAVNRVSAGREGASGTKVMLYTIGLSFSAEMIIKSAWENTIGWLFEKVSGHESANDRLSAMVQQRYGTFMHQTPWYEFPFGKAFGMLWDTNEPVQVARQWERRLALSMEYGVKAGYAGLIGWASGATLGRDQLTLRFVTPAPAADVSRLDSRFKIVGQTMDGRTIVEAPRYAEYTALLRKLAAARVPIHDIAGNDDIFLTVLAPDDAKLPGETLFTMPLGDRPGWQRVGLEMKVAGLAATLPAIERAGGRIEHVHDY